MVRTAARVALDAESWMTPLNPSGKPTACHVHWPTLDQLVNDRICKTLLSKGKFQPAKDPAGQPMASYWVGNPQFLGPPMPGFRR